MQRKLNDTVICCWVGKTSCKAKIPPGEFQVITLKNLLINNQVVTSIRNLNTTLTYPKILTYSWTFTLISNWTWSCGDFFLCTDSSTWLTPSNWLIVVGCKIIHFKHVEGLEVLGYKTLRCTKRSNFSQSIWVL